MSTNIGAAIGPILICFHKMKHAHHLIVLLFLLYLNEGEFQVGVKREALRGNGRGMIRGGKFSSEQGEPFGIVCRCGLVKN
jgi:hypothetical protein